MLLKRNHKKSADLIASAEALMKEKMPNASKKEKADMLAKIAEPAADLEHLDEDGELPWGWHTYHDHEFTDQIESKFNYFRTQWIVSRNSGSPQEECAALKSLLVCMDDAQRASDQKGECYSFWCSEYLINQEWKSKLQEQLKDLEENMDEKIAEYERRMETSSIISDDLLLSEIQKHEGILQKDFYKLFSGCDKNIISEKLYYMAKEGKIERTKSGNSYILKSK